MLAAAAALVVAGVVAALFTAALIVQAVVWLIEWVNRRWGATRTSGDSAS